MRYLLLFAVLLLHFWGSAQPDSLAMVGDSVPVVRDTVIFSKLGFEAFTRQARFENKPYFVMFSASWCAPCHRIKKELFADQQIAVLANQHYLAFYLDIESFDGAEVNSKRFKVSQLPTVIFFDPQGRETDRAIGYFDGYYFFRKLRAHIPQSQWGPDWQEPHLPEPAGDSLRR